MASSQVFGQEIGHNNHKKSANEFPFLGSTLSEIAYEDDYAVFEADIALIESSPNDSGYFSGDGLDDSQRVIDSENATIPHDVQAANTFAEELYGGTAASVKANHGSIYDGQKIESTKYIGHGTFPNSQSTVSTKRSDDKPPRRKYSDFDDEVTGPSQLDLWAETHERHESIAYKFEQPAKRRKATISRQ